MMIQTPGAALTVPAFHFISSLPRVWLDCVGAHVPPREPARAEVYESDAFRFVGGEL